MTSKTEAMLLAGIVKRKATGRTRKQVLIDAAWLLEQSTFTACNYTLLYYKAKRILSGLSGQVDFLRGHSRVTFIELNQLPS